MKIRENHVSPLGHRAAAGRAVLVALRTRAVRSRPSPPQRGTAVEIVYATGAVEPVRWAKVASLIRDRIVEICDCEGKTVAKGDVLVRLDDREVRAQLKELGRARNSSSAKWRAVTELIGRGAATTQAHERASMRSAADPGADRGADREDRRLHDRRADGRRRAAPRRRDRRDRRGRADAVPRRRAEAAAGGGRGQRGGHSARRGRPDGAVAHRRISRAAARRQGARDHADGRSRSPRPTASASRCPTTRRSSPA